MKRVFIIGNCRFPRGSALANYIQYLTRAIMDGGYETYIVSDINPEFIENSSEGFNYDNYNLIPISISDNRVVKHYQYKTGFTRERIHSLKQNKINKDDVIILLSHNSTFYKRIIRISKKMGCKVAVGILEMFDRSNYGGSDKSYLKYLYVLNELLPQFDLVLPISSYIDEYYKNKGCRTFCLPIMADCQEYPILPKDNDKYSFILPGNGKMKDDLSSMIKGFTLLSDVELAKIEIHVCGVKEEKVREQLSEGEYQRLMPVLTIHKWMKYDELVELYQKMHFLILAREDSQMTRANFPSKVPETMGFGIVPVCTDIGDYTKYYLNDGIDSIFMKGSSPEICSEAIKKAVNLPWEEYEKMSANARKTVETKFDYRVWTSRIKEQLENL